VNNVCQSGYCIGGFCSECPTIDSSRGCASHQFCRGQVNGNRCENKRDNGGTCLSNNVCKSGKCVIGFCWR